MPDWRRMCGGLGWRTLATGAVEVEGAGVPTDGPNARGYLERTWKNWGPLLRRHGRAHGVPTAWMLAIASAETGYLAKSPEAQRTAVSPANALGIMQLLRSTARDLGMPEGADIFDPDTNVEYGARELAMLIRRYGLELPEVAAGYNAGAVHCTGKSEYMQNPWRARMDDDYVSVVVRHQNTARGIDLDRPSLASAVGSAIGVGALAVGFAALAQRALHPGRASVMR